MVVLDKLTYAGNLANLAPVLDDPRLRFVEGDILDRAAGRQADGASATRSCTSRPRATSTARSSGAADFVMTNVVGTQTLLDSALQHGIAKFVHVSTDEVYGSIERGQLGRGAAARAQLAVLRLEGFQRPARPRLLPHPRAAGVRDAMLEQLRALPVPREGHPAVRHQPDRRRARSRCTARARTSATGCTSTTTAAASTWCSSGGRPGEVYNIGGGTELPNKELTGLLLAACGTDWDRVENVEDRKGHDLRYSVDITKIQRELGYQPQVDFEQGLADTVTWYPENRAWWEPLKDRARL